jgi:hypothetical protein
VPLCALLAVAVAFIISLLFFPGSVFSAADSVLEQSGILYPDGYDINTVGEVQGKAYSFVQPEKGPARFTLVTKSDAYTVFVAPAWYWNDYGVTIKNGQEMLVTGSKSLGKDGNLYIIAQEMHLPGVSQPLVFRGKEGLPLWKPFGSGTSQGRGGFGSSTGGKGVSGSGGAGRGRR